MRLVSTAFLTCAVGAASALAAGDVRVAAFGVNIRITGDGLANAIRIVSGLGAGTLVVEPFDNSTSVNGRTTPVRFERVSGSVRVELFDGADVVVVEDAHLPADLQVFTGGEDDEVQLDRTSVGGRLRMDTGSGDDRVLLDLASIAGRVRIATGSGDDDVRVAGGSSLSADALVSAGAGADRLGFDDVALGRGLKLALDDGSDIAAVNFTSAVSGLAVSGGDGFDFYLDGEGNAFSSLRLVGVESTP